MGKNGESDEKWEKVGKLWTSWKKWGKVGKSGEKLEKVGKSWKKWGKVGKMDIVRQPDSYTLHGKLKFFFRWILYHWDLYNAYPADNKSVSLS